MNNNNKKTENINDKSLKTKLLDNKIKKSHFNNKYIRPHSPNLDREKNKLFILDNLEITADINENKNKNFELFLDNKKN